MRLRPITRILIASIAVWALILIGIAAGRVVSNAAGAQQARFDQATTILEELKR